ncbi:AAA family ATPase [Subtercola boreus]|uniref:ATP-binding protein n=1 Tax=Subtercola boreus TaxID=120213 RepID=A0A3E0W8F5_9MICO|nr:AAA family ATPase [Subtercola boreus]RFA17832.1 ATP-binding protein [Subtercola boreus]RFA17871.1 ATP-binding protein [Subtercola boreus]RFA24460.1 ATP-binding protein [Subtercola boreus]
MNPSFIVTKEHRRFTEFANVVRKEHTIGICFGDAGVGKTISARRYASWDLFEPHISAYGPIGVDTKQAAAANKARTVFYTPEVLCRPRTLATDIEHLSYSINTYIRKHAEFRAETHETPRQRKPISTTELIIIDESERLTPNAIEILRDHHDRTRTAIILIGMPGIDQQFRHYPQLYSRLGFAHHYRTLASEELLFVLDRQWKHLGQTLNPDDFTDAQAVAAIERITRGNFRLLERLFPQIKRVLAINELETITDDVIEAAASVLVIGN